MHYDILFQVAKQLRKIELKAMAKHASETTGILNVVRQLADSNAKVPRPVGEQINNLFGKMEATMDDAIVAYATDHSKEFALARNVMSDTGYRVDDLRSKVVEKVAE